MSSVFERLVAAAAGPSGSGGSRVIGLAGGVASGKSSLAAELAAALGDASVVGTDVFLYPNAELDARGLTMRKGFPDSYDWSFMLDTIAALRTGAVVAVPRYSHVLYDIEPDVRVDVGGTRFVVVEGVNALQPQHGSIGSVRGRYDLSLFLEVAEDDARRWFVERKRRVIRDAADTPSSFYFTMSDWSDADIDAFAESVWTSINLPNLREHIAPSARHADLVVVKDGHHRIVDLHPPGENSQSTQP